MNMTITPDQSLQAAIDSLPNDGSMCVIKMTEGTWHEKIELCRPDTIILGAGMDKTHILWQDAATDPMDDIGHRGTFRTATVRTDGKRIHLSQLHIGNTAGPRERVGQCIALYAEGDGLWCTDCRLTGGQDTLFTAPLPPRENLKNGFVGPKQFAPRVPQRQFFFDCRIEGDVDFIFGGASAWFGMCDIVSIDSRQQRDQPYCGYVTAASTPQGQPFGYVFRHCRFLGEGVPDGSVYLGRPWREYARTVLIECELGPHIHPEKWHDWGKKDFAKTGLYALYNCTGPGAQGGCAPFARMLTEDDMKGYGFEDFLHAPLPEPFDPLAEEH